MSLVFAGITPHPPLLIPSIGKENSEKLKKTHDAFLKMEESLYLSKPNIVMIISPHGTVFEDSFCINAHTHFIGSYETFGDHDTKDEWKGATDFAAHIGHMGNEERVEVQLISEEKLDHGISIPLHFLMQHLQITPILPISPSKLKNKDHVAFGSLLKEACMDTDKRIAVIVSTDLSHTLTSDSPAGFSKHGEIFDKKIIELFQAHNSTGIINMNEDIVSGAQSCGYNALLIFLGILQNMNYEFKHHTYETPFGIGYLSGECILN